MGGVNYYIIGLRKFYKVHIITFILALVLQIFWLWKWPSLYAAKRAIGCLIPNLLLIQSFFLNSEVYFSYNSVSWYLSDILFFYFMSPFLFKSALKLNRNKRLLGAICVSWLISIIIAMNISTKEYIHAILYISPFYRLIDYFIGILLGTIFVERKLYNRINIGENKYSLCVFQLFVLLLFCYMSYFRCFTFIPEKFKYSVMYTPIACLLILAFGINTGNVICRFMGCKVFEFLSNISFELFMLHQVVIKYVNEFCFNIKELPDSIYYVLVFGITFIGAFILKRWKVGRKE